MKDQTIKDKPELIVVYGERIAHIKIPDGGCNNSPIMVIDSKPKFSEVIQSLKDNIDQILKTNPNAKIKIIVAAHGTPEGGVVLGQINGFGAIYPSYIFKALREKGVNVPLTTNVTACHAGANMPLPNKKEIDEGQKTIYDIDQKNMMEGDVITRHGGKYEVLAVITDEVVKVFLDNNGKSEFETMIARMMLPYTFKIRKKIKSDDGADRFLEFQYHPPKPTTAAELTLDNYRNHIVSEMERFKKFCVENRIFVTNQEEMERVLDSYKSSLTTNPEIIRKYLHLDFMVAATEAKEENNKSDRSRSYVDFHIAQAVANGLNINYQHQSPDRKANVLALCVSFGCVESVKSLSDAIDIANINEIRNNNGADPRLFGVLDLALESINEKQDPRYFEIAKILIKKGSSLTPEYVAMDRYHNEPRYLEPMRSLFLWGVRENKVTEDYEFLEKILKLTPNLLVGEYGSKVLEKACGDKDYKMIDFLIKNNATPSKDLANTIFSKLTNAYCTIKPSPTTTARIDLFKSLTKSLLATNLIDDDCKKSALISASNKTRTTAEDFIQLLIDDNPDNVNCCDDDLRTPLHIALSSGSFNIAKKLIQNKAKIDAKDDRGQTPADFVRDMENEDEKNKLLSTIREQEPNNTVTKSSINPLVKGEFLRK
jgi:ankyrin repeat protein